MHKQKYQRTDFDFWTTIETRWRDLDALRHINHATYLTYMEDARIAFYHEMGMVEDRWDENVATILGGMTISWLKQVNHPSTLEVGQRLSRIGSTSFDLLTGIFIQNENTPVCVADFKLVAFDYKQNTPVPVPAFFQEWYNPIEK